MTARPPEARRSPWVRSANHGVVLLALVWALAPGTAQRAGAELPDAELDQVRSVRQRDWLRLRLQVLGLRLTYPAYRVSVDLGDSNRVRFSLWLSSPMAQHLQDSGRLETARLLTYHADGIGRQVEELLKADFPGLWTEYDRSRDFLGEFMVPGQEIDTPPRTWARWEGDELVWKP